MTVDVVPNTAPASTEQYEAEATLATYLHAEWADLLTPGRDPAPAELAVPGSFYRRVAGLVASWAGRAERPARTVCDVGAATGRTVYELAGRLPHGTAFTLVEPSHRLAGWARTLLAGAAPGLRVPVPHVAGSPATLLTTGGTVAVPTPVETVVTHADDVALGGRAFDAVTSLNVVDRVPDPRGLVRTLARLVRPGGLLVLASPLDFDLRYTPGELWVDDVRELLDGVAGEVVATAELPYAFLHYARRSTSYLSQVVAVRTAPS